MKRNFKVLLVILVIVFLIFYFKSPESDITDYVLKKPASIISQSCQFLETVLTGNENFVDDKNNLELNGLVVVFRHGERSPLFKGLPSISPDCSAYYDVDRKSFEDYIDLVNSKDFRKFIKTDKSFSDYRWYPERSKCIEGNMTAEGALQLVKLGNYLRDRYKNSNIFNNNVNINLTSSLYYRTFQSAIAFSSSFLYPESNKIGNIFIRPSNTTYFCMNKDCICDGYSKMLDNYHNARSTLYQQKYTKLNEELTRIAELMGLTEIKSPIVFIDFVLGKYACRRLPLPCFTEDTCLTVEKFTRAHEIIYELTSELFLTSKAMRSLYAAESYPILQSVATLSRKLRKPDNKNNYIKIFSAHDITLAPLILTLGMNVTMFPPPYGSRLIFEVYQTKDNSIINDSVYIRVIYNGIDYTSYLKFCKQLYYGLCPARHFESFVKIYLKDLADANDLSSVCNNVQ